MLRKRLIAGSILAAAIGGVLVADSHLSPWFPCLLVVAMLAGFLSTRELVALLPTETKPSFAFCCAGVLSVLAANWYYPLSHSPYLPQFADPWHPVFLAFTAFVIATFLFEMNRYREPGHSVVRIALTIWTVAYLALLPSFFLRMRWFDGGFDTTLSSWMLAVTIFVPKCGDIGAYFTGKAIGRIPFAPLLSPKKTWEGFIGGLLASVVTAVAVGEFVPLFRYGVTEAIAFGVVVGIMAVLGDLAESLIKRDCQTKDAAKSIPGFGGLLDVIDSVLFAGPVAYVWLNRN